MAVVFKDIVGSLAQKSTSRTKTLAHVKFAGLLSRELNLSNQHDQIPKEVLPCTASHRRQW